MKVDSALLTLDQYMTEVVTYEPSNLDITL